MIILAILQYFQVGPPLAELSSRFLQWQENVQAGKMTSDESKYLRRIFAPDSEPKI